MRKWCLLLLLAAAWAGGSGGESVVSAPRTGSAIQALSMPGFCSNYPRPMPPNGWEAKAVHYATSSGGVLVYEPGPDGSRVPDFSYAGYKNGMEKPPAVAEVERVQPGPGDDTSRIQQAIDRMRERKPNPDGFRGAIVLAPGRYELAGTVRINVEGVVLRGSGRCGNSAVDTVLVATGRSPAPRLVLGTGAESGWDDEVAGTRVEVTRVDPSFHNTRLHVADERSFQRGDTVVVVHPTTPAWIAAVDGGGTASDPAWTPTNPGPIVYKRKIILVSARDHSVTLDAPIYNDLDRNLTTPYVAKLQPGSALARVGVENLRVMSELAGDVSRDNQVDSIEILGAEDAWVRNVNTMQFSLAGVRVRESVRVTVQNVEASNPSGPRDAGRMYNFMADERAQLVLFVGCIARAGRHHFVSNGASTASGIAFVRSRSEGLDSEISEGHRKWSQALLYDNIREVGGGSVHLGCRGSAGSSHGWSATNSVIWNHHFNGGNGFVEDPPQGRNWAFGVGNYTRKTEYCGSAPSGHIEERGGVLRQESLYEAQLCERLVIAGGSHAPPDFTDPPASCSAPPSPCAGQKCCEPVPGGCNLCVPLGRECP